ncbi:MAG: histidine ammonia-lyase, partial [Planctomycetota bacterium]
MKQSTLHLQPGNVSLAQLRQVYKQEIKVTLDEAVYDAIDASAAVVKDILATGQTVYGINTGFGLLAQTRIEDDQLAELQKNLVLSHSTGVGSNLDVCTTRLILFLKLNSLALGYSGVSRTAFTTLAAFINYDILPYIPAKGSVGASGDLAPLAHMTAALMGIGDVIYKGTLMSAVRALQEVNLEPLTLGPKEGLAFLNGTQVSTALAIVGLLKTEHLFSAAIIAGAMSVDAMKGTDASFDPRIHKVRGQLGQIILAEKYLSLLEGSDIRASHLDCDHVQDPYSLRCQPQVMGACLDIINNVSQCLLIEANAVTD